MNFYDLKTLFYISKKYANKNEKDKKNQVAEKPNIGQYKDIEK